MITNDTTTPEASCKKPQEVVSATTGSTFVGGKVDGYAIVITTFKQGAEKISAYDASGKERMFLSVTSQNNVAGSELTQQHQPHSPELIAKIHAAAEAARSCGDFKPAADLVLPPASVRKQQRQGRQ